MCVCVCVRERYLVDLVHHPEGAAVELLQGHEVQHGGDAALSSALMVRRQLVELSAAVELHTDSDPILVVLLLIGKTAFKWGDNYNSYGPITTKNKIP